MPLLDPKRPGKKKKKEKPDEVFQHGPIQLARFGRLVVGRNVAPSEYFDEIRKKAPEIIKEHETEIKAGIERLCAILVQIDPIAFLTRAYGEYFAKHIGIRDEPSLNKDHNLALRLVDYCTSMFAALPATDNRRSHTEEEFDSAKEAIKQIFEATRHYVMWSNMAAGNEGDKRREALSELVTKLTLQWIFVRSDRYSYFEMVHYRALLDPLSSILKRILGVTSAQLLQGLEKILKNAQQGFFDAGLVLKDLHERSTSHPGFVDALALSQPQRYETIVKLSGLDPKAVHDATEAFFGSRLFKVEISTEWPTALIDKLSYAPGDASWFLEPPQTAGWPTRIWPIFRRPFLKVGSSSYCFDYISLFDRFYRQLLRLLREEDPTCTEEINRIQSSALESETAALLTRLLPGSRIYRNCYYRAGSEWCECDVIVAYKDVLFAIEARSGSLTPTSPTEDLPSYFRSIEALIVKPASQAWRTLDVLETGELEIFDSNKSDRSSLAVFRRESYRFLIPTAVSLDQLSMLGAHVANTLDVAEAQSKRPTWVLSIDDLRCIAEIFDGPTSFLHYAELRMKAAAEASVEAHDEMDHVGLYLRENDYISQTLDFPGRMHRHGYTTPIDHYFFHLGVGEIPDKPKQEMPAQIRALVRAADNSSMPLSRWFVSKVLDADSETRSEISTWLEHQHLNPAGPGRFRILSLFIDDEIVFFAVSDSWSSRERDRVYDEAKARLLKAPKQKSLSGCTIRIEGQTPVLDHCWDISKHSISEDEVARLQSTMREQTDRDFKSAPRKIGRNDPCPCGSGLKYKKCCLVRKQTT